MASSYPAVGPQSGFSIPIFEGPGSWPYDIPGVSYDRMGSIRTLPAEYSLVRDVRDAVQAIDPSLTVEVHSAGQPSSGPNRTGSHRHDVGASGEAPAFDFSVKNTATGEEVSPTSPTGQAIAKSLGAHGMESLGHYGWGWHADRAPQPNTLWGPTKGAGSLNQGVSRSFQAGQQMTPQQVATQYTAPRIDALMGDLSMLGVPGMEDPLATGQLGSRQLGDIALNADAMLSAPTQVASAPVPTPRPSLSAPTAPSPDAAFAIAPDQAPTAAEMAADIMATPGAGSPPSIPALDMGSAPIPEAKPAPPSVPVPDAKPAPMTVTQQDVLDAYSRSLGGTPAPGTPVPTSKPVSSAPVPAAKPASTAPMPAPNPMAMVDRAPPIPTANPLAQAQQPQMAFAGNNGPALPTAAPPGGITNEPGFIQGLAPSLVDRAKELGLEAPDGKVIGYSPLAPNGLAAVNADAGPGATGPGLFGFADRDFGIGGDGAKSLASYAGGMPGRIGGSLLGGAAGTALGGPVGGLLGAMLGGYAGGQLTSGLMSQNAAMSLGQQPQHTGLWGTLSDWFSGGESSSDGISQESRDAIANSTSGGLW